MLMKVVQNGLGIPENTLVFGVSALNSEAVGLVTEVPVNGKAGQQKRLKVEGDVYVVKAACLDMALWKVGGAGVALKLVQAANVGSKYHQCYLGPQLTLPFDFLSQTQHEVSRTLGILTDGLKNSWQNSEDMERLR
jgi:hypothetical protein